MKRHHGLLAAAVLAANGLATAALASTTHQYEIVGSGLITEIETDGYCNYQTQQCFPTELVYPNEQIDVSLRFSATFNENGDLIGLDNITYSGFPYGARVVGGDFEFTSGALTSGFFFTDPENDQCGGGLSVEFSPRQFTFSVVRCGWKYSIDPFITTRGAGSYSQFRDGMAVPEPTTWALMILGFGAAGASLRRRRVASA